MTRAALTYVPGADQPPTSGPATVTDLVRAWADGWVVSRQAAEPVAQPWGWSIDVGTFKEAGRAILPAADEATVRELARSTAAPGRWLKVFLPEVSVAPEAAGAAEALATPWLGPDWAVDLPGFLMSTPLRTAALRVPDGYRLREWTRGGVLRTAVFAADGSLAARGQLAPTGATAVADQIETAPSHRRRGLGSLVMTSLHNRAVERGADTGILVGTAEGRALYEAVGWHTHAPMVSAYFRNVTAR